MSPYTITQENGLSVVNINEAILLPRPNVARINFARLMEARSKEDIPMIFPLVHALHADTITRNRTFYPEETLKAGSHTALRPYPIPYIRDHNSTGSGSSDTYGRVLRSQMTDDALTGTKVASMIVGVGHPHAVNQILCGNWQSVSMGSKTEHAFCGICNKDLTTDDHCDHSFDDPKFHVKIGKQHFEYREMSDVKVPSDPHARIASPDGDPLSDMQMYGARDKEHIYDLADPKRRNLLESCSVSDQYSIEAIYQSMDWLLEEFKPVRKKYFIANESARLAEKELTVQVTNPKSFLTYEQISELPDEAFGLILVDEKSMKRFRRFPMTATMAVNQREFVKAQIEQAKALTPEQRVTLLGRLEKDDVSGDSLIVELNGGNYTVLLDMLDGERAERAAWETVALTESAAMDTAAKLLADEAAAKLIADEASAAATAAELAAAVTATKKAEDDAAAAKKAEDEATAAKIEADKKKKKKKKSDDDDDDDDANDDTDNDTDNDDYAKKKEAEILDLQARLVTEQNLRVELMAGIIARQKIELGERITKDKTLEELTAYYQGKSMETLEDFLEELQPTFAITTKVAVTDLSEIEKVPNPVAPKLTQGEIEAGAAAGAVSLTEADPSIDHLKEFADLAALYGGPGYAAASNVVKAKTDFDFSY